MKRSIAAALLPAAALLLSARTARSELWTDDALTRETSACALGRTMRQQATTRACLGCHDGTSAAGVEVRRAGASTSRMHDSHPVDVDYAMAELRRPSRFHTLASLPPSLVLPGGKVTCVTCHDGASREQAHAAVTTDRSRLCTSCHDL
jgi:predicted CXXCH cytochrome family protein